MSTFTIHLGVAPTLTKVASMVHDLIQAYGLLSKTKVVKSSPATYDDLRKFHSEIYLDHLKSLIDIDDEYATTAQDEEFGIGYDCPPVSNMYELISSIAGGSITAAKCLILGVADVAINWCGGWHHAQRFAAEGFCYVNDIVIAIETLKQKFPKILYIDLDVHHGNGVQDAYNLSKSVVTMSFHKYEPGFYPGSGGIDDIGTLAGQGYSYNFPLHGFYTDNTLEYAFDGVFEEVYSRFSPNAVVVQCGADALARDPHGGASLTAKGYCRSVRKVLDKRKPTMLLGGGGYNHANAARLWSQLTALALGITLEENIPEHDNWPLYGPDYLVHIEAPMVKDTNKKSYLDDCIVSIKDNIQKFLSVPKQPEIKVKTADLNVSKYTKKERDKCHHHTCEIVRDIDTKENVLSFSRQMPCKDHDLISQQMKNNKSDCIDVYDFVD